METVNEQGVKNLVFAIIARAIIDYEKALLNVELTRGIGGFTHKMAISRASEKKKFFESLAMIHVYANSFCYISFYC